jgi:PAS domain S-box-containing protein
MEYTGTTLEQNLGYGWLQALHPDDAAPTQEVWAQAVATSDVYQTEFRLRRADNTYRWHLARAVKVKDETSDIVKWFGTCTDIEDHKRAEVERTEMLEREQMLRSKAEEANRMKDEFVATVSHELRSPLNAILGWARMMRAGALDAATTRKAIDVIERSADNQARLIDDLLDMSRIITGKLRLDLKTLDPATFVRAALEAVTPTAKAKDIKIVSDLDPNINAIAGDANRLQQVVWNLLSNAIKFTPKGGRINARLARDGSQIVFSVTDTGQGISPEFLPYVFDRFRQADATSIRKHGGLGLGLSIARHLVELHGGLITVESAGQDQGATFTVRLPILPVQLTNEELEPAADLRVNLPPPNAEAVLSGLLILAVDDEPDARQLLAQILTAYGATVTTTDTAESALEIIQEQQPDLLVSDIGMPNNDGYNLIRRVRELEQGQARRMPAIALTAYARPRDRMQALAAGFNHHVPKPVEPAELVTVITSLTGRLSLSDS